MGAVAKQSYTFYDAKQQSARTSMYLDNTLDGDAVLANGEQIAIALAGISNSSQTPGNLIRANGPFTTAPIPVAPGTAATYLDASDKAVFVFQDGNGGLHKYEVACPKTAIFQADQETVDFTVAGVKLFVANMTFTTFGGTAPVTTAAVNTRQGIPLTASVGGYRRRVKAPRKFNIYTRNAALSGGGGAP